MADLQFVTLFPAPESESSESLRVASNRPYSQPRRPSRANLPISHLERRVINSRKFQYEIAAEAGINPSLLSNIIHGRKGASAEVLFKLARYFNCDPKELIGYE